MWDKKSGIQISSIWILSCNAEILLFESADWIAPSLQDGFFSEVLQSSRLPRDEHEIVLNQDGSWDPSLPKKDVQGNYKIFLFLFMMRPSLMV